MPITTNPKWTKHIEASEKRREKDKIFRAIENHYRDSRSKLVGLAYTSLQNHADAEESVQDAYVNALNYWETYDKTFTMHDWLLQIVRNCISKKWADISKSGMSVEYVESQDNRSEGENLLSRYQKAQLLATIAALPTYGHKRIVELFVFKDLGPKEIAEQVPENLQNVKKVIARFKEGLKSDDESSST